MPDPKHETDGFLYVSKPGQVPEIIFPPLIASAPANIRNPTAWISWLNAGMENPDLACKAANLIKDSLKTGSELVLKNSDKATEDQSNNGRTDQRLSFEQLTLYGAIYKLAITASVLEERIDSSLLKQHPEISQKFPDIENRKRIYRKFAECNNELGEQITRYQTSGRIAPSR